MSIEWSNTVLKTALDFERYTSCPNAALAAALKSLAAYGKPGEWHVRHVPMSHGLTKKVVLNGRRA